MVSGTKRGRVLRVEVVEKSSGGFEDIAWEEVRQKMKDAGKMGIWSVCCRVGWRGEDWVRVGEGAGGSHSTLDATLQQIRVETRVGGCTHFTRRNEQHSSTATAQPQGAWRLGHWTNRLPQYGLRSHASPTDPIFVGSSRAVHRPGHPLFCRGPASAFPSPIFVLAESLRFSFSVRGQQTHSTIVSYLHLPSPLFSSLMRF